MAEYYYLPFYPAGREPSRTFADNSRDGAARFLDAAMKRLRCVVFRVVVLAHLRARLPRCKLTRRMAHARPHESPAPPRIDRTRTAGGPGQGQRLAATARPTTTTAGAPRLPTEPVVVLVESVQASAACRSSPARCRNTKRGASSELARPTARARCEKLADSTRDRRNVGLASFKITRAAVSGQRLVDPERGRDPDICCRASPRATSKTGERTWSTRFPWSTDPASITTLAGEMRTAALSSAARRGGRQADGLRQDRGADPGC